MSAGLVCLLSFLSICGLIFIWICVDEFGYSDFADFCTELGIPALLSVAILAFIVSFVFVLVGAMEQNPVNEKASTDFIEKRETVVEQLKENPFGKDVIKDAVAWNGDLELRLVDDENGDYADLVPIDYVNYQRKYAQDKLNMTSADGTEIIDETVIEIDKEDFESLRNYINKLEAQLEKESSETSKDDIDGILNKYAN